MTQETTEKTNILTAMRLGWLLVETFGRIRMYQMAKRKPAFRISDKAKPFTYSDSNESGVLDELVWCIDQLHEHYNSLAFSKSYPLPLLRGKKFIEELIGKRDSILDAFLDKKYDELDEFGKTLAGLLNAYSGPSSQALRYGGSLANTYWYLTTEWSEKNRKHYLNPARLNRIAENIEHISDDLPVYLADILANSLRRWSTLFYFSNDKGKSKDKTTRSLVVKRRYQRFDLLNPDPGKQELKKLKERLRAQQDVWQDLLFERRKPESYLWGKHFHTIRFYKVSTQFLFGLALLIVIYFAGREVGELIPTGESKDLSSFVAAISSYIVVLGGLVSQLSSWINSVGQRVAERSKRQMILEQTFRPPLQADPKDRVINYPSEQGSLETSTSNENDMDSVQNLEVPKPAKAKGRSKRPSIKNLDKNHISKKSRSTKPAQKKSKPNKTNKLSPINDETNSLFADAVDLVRKEGRVSISFLQRRLRIGYTQATRLLDAMEEMGVVGPPNGKTKTRQILLQQDPDTSSK